MNQELLYRKFDNGLVLLGEHMPWLRSAAFSLHLPAGTCYEPNGLDGLSGMTNEMVQRGCGELDSRQFLERLDELGVERGSSITTNHSSFSCAMPREVLPETLGLYSDLVRTPHLPADQLDDARQLSLQDLRALDDEASHRCFSELKRFRYPLPFGRISQGTREGLAAIDHQKMHHFFQDTYKPAGSILAVAGNFDWTQVCDLVEARLGDWTGAPPRELPELKPNYGSRHVDHSTNQIHLALAYECEPYESPEYYESRALVGVLSDGMSSRLFTEVREKRGLVYSVFATCFSLAGLGSVLCYAGTTTNRAEETLQVLLETIFSLRDGITVDELERLKYRIKSSLVFEQESSAARSSQIASDWFYLGRVPTREEVCARVDALTCEGLQQHFCEHLPKNFSLVTVGSQALELPDGIANAQV
ncbi:M16 family metallopeptidase [Aureliella helgolandensis]|uniref:Peptidase M16 inactive domain protein n=1 Tax=Aureliella helgolandensis TaxID=2527968 RepID=A0A518GEN8_9BACT|nr:pitrilysin family protein [Aureliella helgolandensis]QDV27064.1 Peptidase M16 inactive domain protein [Aureliella helgolandensis]